MHGSRRLLCARTRRQGRRASVLLALFALSFLPGCSRNPTPESPGKSEPQSQGAAWFSDATAQVGLLFVHQLADGKLDNIMESDGAGGTVLDFDNDGFMDVYLVNSGPAPAFSDAPPETVRSPNRLFHNRGDGTFEDVTKQAGVEGHGFGTTAAAADYDNDGFTDLLVVNFDGLILFRNQQNGTFKDVSTSAGLTSRQPGISATFFDADKDGKLDIFVANYLKFDRAIKVPPGTSAPYPGPLSYESEYNLLFRNAGDGKFLDVSESSGIRIPGHRAMSATAIDFDQDGDQDLYVSNDGTPNLLLENDGKGRFKDVALQRGAAFNQFGEAAGSMGATVGDSNADGWPDMFVSRFGNGSLYLNAHGLFEDRIQSSGLLEPTSRYTGWGSSFLDAQNDGALDLFIVNGHAHFLQGMPCLLLLNNGSGSFSNSDTAASASLSKPLSARGCLVADFSNNGRQSVIVTTLGGPAVYLQNVIPNSNHWIALRLCGTCCNRNGFGARVRVSLGGRTLSAEARCPTSYVSQGDSRLHFGLGSAKAIDRIEVKWPCGKAQILEHPPVDQVLRVTEQEKPS